MRELYARRLVEQLQDDTGIVIACRKCFDEDAIQKLTLEFIAADDGSTESASVSQTNILGQAAARFIMHIQAPDATVIEHMSSAAQGRMLASHNISCKLTTEMFPECDQG